MTMQGGNFAPMLDPMPRKSAAILALAERPVLDRIHQHHRSRRRPGINERCEPSLVLHNGKTHIPEAFFLNVRERGRPMFKVPGGTTGSLA
jgi:hypothetical protein